MEYSLRFDIDAPGAGPYIEPLGTGTSIVLANLQEEDNRLPGVYDEVDLAVSNPGTQAVSVWEGNWFIDTALSLMSRTRALST